MPGRGSLAASFGLSTALAVPAKAILVSAAGVTHLGPQPSPDRSHPPKFAYRAAATLLPVRRGFENQGGLPPSESGGTLEIKIMQTERPRCVPRQVLRSCREGLDFAS